jgi:hypothetical protein
MAPTRSARRSSWTSNRSSRLGGIRPATYHPTRGLRIATALPIGSTYTEYFKEDDDVPSRLCPIDRGTVKQRVTRAIEGIFGGLGRKLKGIFK